MEEITERVGNLSTANSTPTDASSQPLTRGTPSSSKKGSNAKSTLPKPPTSTPTRASPQPSTRSTPSSSKKGSNAKSTLPKPPTSTPTRASPQPSTRGTPSSSKKGSNAKSTLPKSTTSTPPTGASLQPPAERTPKKNKRRDFNCKRMTILTGKSFMAAKSTLINLINTILGEEPPNSYFYIGKTFIEKKKKHSFIITDPTTWKRDGISTAHGSYTDKLEHPEVFKENQKMFILAPIDETILKDESCEQINATNFDAETYTLALEAVLIKHYMDTKNPKIANKSTAAGNSSDRGRFVIYLRVAKAKPDEDIPEKKSEPDTDPVFESESDLESESESDLESESESDLESESESDLESESESESESKNDS